MRIFIVMRQGEKETAPTPANETAEQKIARLEKALSERETLVADLTSKNEKLTNEVLYLRRRLFGRSSERFVPEDPNQLSLAFEGEEVLAEEKAEADTEVVTVTYSRKKESSNGKPVREAIPENLRREDEIIEPEHVPEGAVRIGEEITEKLEYLPGEVYVKRTIRPKYALPKGEGIVIGELPTQVLLRSNAGASLLSHLLVSKYQDHQPFYRQLDIFKRQDIHLEASTVNGWSQDTVDLLQPLYETLRKQILSSDYIQVDESIIPVVNQDKPGATRKGYHWIVKSPVQNQLFFHYQHGSRAQSVVVQLLRNFRGAVQSDGYGAYNIYENKQDVLLLGCMAQGGRMDTLHTPRNSFH